MLAILALVTVLLAALPAVASARWTAPVPGAVTRGFDVGANPFEGGHHRGADLAAARGGAVRAPCGGVVQVAARVGTSGRVVTVLCGRWRVSVMPLARVAVRAGERVRRGARVGTATAGGRGHAGLHLGVRRDGDRFGYVDPLRFLARERVAPPPLSGPPPRRVLHPRPAAAPAGSSPVRAPPPPAALAPWPAWAGLALLLSGAVGAGAVRAVRGRRAALPRAVPQQVRSPA